MNRRCAWPPLYKETLLNVRIRRYHLGRVCDKAFMLTYFHSPRFVIVNTASWLDGHVSLFSSHDSCGWAWLLTSFDNLAFDQILLRGMWLACTGDLAGA